MAQRLRKLVAVAGINGEIRPLEQLFEELTVRNADAIAVVGDLGAPWSKADTYRAMIRVLGEGNRPSDGPETIRAGEPLPLPGPGSRIDLGARSVEAATLSLRAAV